MLVDIHTHIFPHQGGSLGYEDAKIHLMVTQNRIRSRWRKMLTSTTDEKYIPEQGEDVGFRIGKYGRYYWTKHGKECWMQLLPVTMADPEFSAENLIAQMDLLGVEKAVLQSAYMEPNYCRRYFAEAMSKFPERFLGTVRVDYDAKKSDEYRETELRKLRDAIRHMNMKGVIEAYPTEQAQRIDEDVFEPLWDEISSLKVPHIFNIGMLLPKKDYLESVRRIENVLKKFPDINGIILHIGNNVRPRGDPEYTDTPKEFFNLLRLPNAYFEVGYVLRFENYDVWKENSEYPYPLHTRIMKQVYDEVGAEKLLWGSDMPFTYRTCTYRQCLDIVRLHFDFLSEEEKALVVGGNATRLFGI